MKALCPRSSGRPAVSLHAVWGVALIAAALSLSAGCWGFAARGKNAEGVRLFQQARYNEARQQFEQATYEDPTNADGYYNLAATYHRLGKLGNRAPDLKKAEDYYNQCLDHQPNHAECYRGLAVLLAEQGRSEEAFRLIEGWVDRQPGLVDARIEMARLFEETGERRAAKEHLLQALAIDPDNPRALAALGRLRELLGENAQALADYQRSLWRDRFQPEVAARVAALQSAVGASGGTAGPSPAGTRTVSGAAGSLR